MTFKRQLLQCILALHEVCRRTNKHKVHSERPNGRFDTIRCWRRCRHRGCCAFIFFQLFCCWREVVHEQEHLYYPHLEIFNLLMYSGTKVKCMCTHRHLVLSFNETNKICEWRNYMNHVTVNELLQMCCRHTIIIIITRSTIRLRCACINLRRCTSRETMLLRQVQTRKSCKIVLTKG